MNDAKYPFRKENGKVVYLTFAEMMDADASGFVTLKDGSSARRARDLEPIQRNHSERVQLRTDCVSDSMGFTSASLSDMKKHLKEQRIRGVEFKPDPQVPGFFQVHCSSEKAKMAYAKSRGMSDHNSRNGSGAIIGAADLAAAKELVLREHGEAAGASGVA